MEAVPTLQSAARAPEAIPSPLATNRVAAPNWNQADRAVERREVAHLADQTAVEAILVAALRWDQMVHDSLLS